jgi:hypothetical protein
MDNWTDWNQQLFEMIGRCRSVSSGSRAASTVGKECQMIVSNNPDRQSKAASVAGINKAKVIGDFLFSKS